jgi:hypothetical protein
MRRRELLAALALVSAGCASTASEAPATYLGEWEWRFETSSFASSDGRGPWWLSGEGEVWEQISAPITQAGNGPWGRVRLTVEGELSAPGTYGHLGAYERELRVTRVIRAELIEAYSQP